jgi:hypothetical protein
MIFPNRPPDPEIRPGMGYQPGAHALLGYQPGAYALLGDMGDLGYSAPAHDLGYVAHMAYAPGANALGSMSDSYKNAAIDAGINTDDIDLLDSLGATDQDMNNLINGNVSLAQLYAKYGVTIPPPPVPHLAPQQSSTPAQQSSGPAAQVPSGSTLLYEANWSAGVGNLSLSPNSVISTLGSDLAAHGMSIVSSQATSNGPIHYGIQVMVLDTIGHTLKSDAQSILDSLMRQIVGNNLTGSNSSVTTTPGQSTAAGATPTSDPITWLENNALYIGGAVLALILVNNFTGKRR